MKNLTKQVQEIVKSKGRQNKQQVEENIIEWTTFFRRNINIFITDFLEIPLYLFQENMILTMQDNDITDDMASRGSSKTFVVGCFSTAWALLYPNCDILITSFTLNQSNNVIESKIDKELSNTKSGISPVLRQLRKDGYMEVKKDQNTGAKYVEFGNGSKIFAVTCGDSARGKRSQIVITDECVLIKKKDYEEIIEPTLTQRSFVGKPADYIEEPKQIFLSSAKTKTNWMWRHLKNCVTEHYKNKRIKYGFFAVDVFTAVASTIQTKNQYLQRKKTVDDMSFQQEYLNIFLGNNENSLFKFEDFEKNQILEKPFYPRTVTQILDGEENEYVFSDDWIRIIASDIALATGNENDNSIWIFMSINKKTGERRTEYITARHGQNTVNQVLLMKRFFYEYKASYCIQDTKGVGQGVYDLLTVETEDLEYGKVYPAWTVCRDKELQISSNSVIDDKIQRTISDEAEEVLIPYAGTSELNSQMHLLLRKVLKDENISFLKDESEMRAVIEDNDPKFMLKSAEEKALIMLPYLETKYLINEAISLEIKFMENGNIKLQEASRLDVKDRYMTLAMANFLADKIYNKYSKDTDTEIDIEEWNWLSGNFNGF